MTIRASKKLRKLKINQSRKNNCPIALKACLYKATREFFDFRGYLEVQSPVLTPHPGAEVYLSYFQTRWQQNSDDVCQNIFMRSSPELYLKSLLTEDHKKIYEIGPCFRNGTEFSPWHHPEFTMLEFYEQEISYEAFMELTLEFFGSLHSALTGAGFKLRERSFTGQNVYKISVFEAFQRFLGVELVDDDPDLSQKLITLCPSVKTDDDFETAYYKCFIDIFEPKFKDFGVVLLYDFPPSQAALSSVNGGRAKRFEFYIDGIEISNAFLELEKSDANSARLRAINHKRLSLHLPTIDYDSPQLKMLQNDLPPTCGNAVGVERLLSVLVGASSIEPYRDRNGLLPTAGR